MPGHVFYSVINTSRRLCTAVLLVWFCFSWIIMICISRTTANMMKIQPVQWMIVTGRTYGFVWHSSASHETLFWWLLGCVTGIIAVNQMGIRACEVAFHASVSQDNYNGSDSPTLVLVPDCCCVRIPAHISPKEQVWDLQKTQDKWQVVAYLYAWCIHSWWWEWNQWGWNLLTHKVQVKFQYIMLCDIFWHIWTSVGVVVVENGEREHVWSNYISTWSYSKKKIFS